MGYLRCKHMRTSRKHKKECTLGPQDLEFCGPRYVTDTEICCMKIRRAEEKKCLKEARRRKRKPTDSQTENTTNDVDKANTKVKTKYRTGRRRKGK